MSRATETRLRSAFAIVLASAGVSLASACTSGAAASSATSSDGGTTPGYTSLCNTSGSQSLLDGLTATPPFDGAEYRTENAFGAPVTPGSAGGVTPPPPGAAGDQWSGTDGEVVGKLCSTATDQTGCLAKVHGYRVLPDTEAACVAAYPTDEYSQSVCSVTYIVYTRGDEVGVAITDDQTKNLIGTFDTVEEALWAANLAGYTVQCDGSDPSQDSEYQTTANGEFDLQLGKSSGCGEPSEVDQVHVDYAGNVTLVSSTPVTDSGPCATAGRRPDGLAKGWALASSAGGSCAIGEHFATMAALEAASVIAFRRLYFRLSSEGAPRELLARVRQAARDEIKHTRRVRALAEKYGVTYSAPHIARETEARSLFDIAMENAREGCVRETFGALVAHYQAARASDPDVRACMEDIAGEETQHAALSWDIKAFLEERLTPGERAKVDREMSRAHAELVAQVQTEWTEEVQRVTGTPNADLAQSMLAGLGATLLAA